MRYGISLPAFANFADVRALAALAREMLGIVGERLWVIYGMALSSLSKLHAYAQPCVLGEGAPPEVGLSVGVTVKVGEAVTVGSLVGDRLTEGVAEAVGVGLAIGVGDIVGVTCGVGDVVGVLVKTGGDDAVMSL